MGTIAEYLQANDVETKSRGYTEGIFTFFPKPLYNVHEASSQQGQLARTCLNEVFCSYAQTPKIVNLLLKDDQNKAEASLLGAGGNLFQLQGDRVPELAASAVAPEEQLKMKTLVKI